jgi:hypothetical protein
MESRESWAKELSDEHYSLLGKAKDIWQGARSMVDGRLTADE